MAAVVSRGRARRAGGWLGRACFRFVTYAVFAILVLCAVGGAAGRIRLVPAPERVTGTEYSSSDMVVVVPVPVQKLRVDDVIIVRNSKEKALLRIDNIIDSVGPQVHIAGEPPERIRKLGGSAWRVRAAVPFVGLGMGLLAGPIQGILLSVAGFVLVVRSEVRRSRDSAPPGDTDPVAEPATA